MSSPTINDKVYERFVVRDSSGNPEGILLRTKRYSPDQLEARSKAVAQEAFELSKASPSWEELRESVDKNVQETKDLCEGLKETALLVVKCLRKSEE